MVTLIIGIIIGAGIAVKIEWNWIRGIGDFLTEVLLGGIIGLILSLFVMLALPMDTEIKTYTYNIEALQDNSSISGSFFLGSGSIDGSMKYVFYYEDDGGFKMKQIDYDKAIIKYSSEIKVIKYKEEPTDNIINIFAVDICFSEKYEIFVPKGTIKNNYNLDAR